MRRGGHILAGMAAAALAGCFQSAAPLPPTPPTPPHPNSINGMLSRPWHHVGKPVSAQQQAQDEAKCKTLAGMTASGNEEIRLLVNYINCLKASGYEPDPPPQ